MAYTRARCTNFDYCSLADGRRELDVLVGEAFVCPECGKPLKAPPASGGRSLILPLAIGGGLLALLGGAVVLGMRMAGPSAPATAPAAPVAPQGVAAAPPAAAPAPAPAPVPAQSTAATPAPEEAVLLKLAGAATIGEALAPALAEAYLTQIGDSDVTASSGPTAGQVKVVGQRGDRREAILIQSSSAEDGFQRLKADDANLVMAGRRISSAERDGFASQGDMTNPDVEHVLALDALVVVVNAANGVPSLTKEQVRGVLAGNIKDWRALGGAPGPITVYAPTPQSDTGAQVAALVLNGEAQDPGAHVFANGKQVSQAVAGDPRGIGIVALPDIETARAVPIGETGSSPVAPTSKAAVSSEDYPLSYRLYLYGVPKDSTAIAQRFVEFATGPQGQAIVDKQGLVPQGMKAQAAAVAAAAAPETPAQRIKSIVGPAKKLAVDFRFNPNSSDLDLKGARDIDRVTNYLLSLHMTGDHLILVGFADNQGTPEANIGVSKKRADALAAMFSQRGLPPGKVVGFGSDLPLADNATEDGRQKNRRVEVYVMP